MARRSLGVLLCYEGSPRRWRWAAVGQCEGRSYDCPNAGAAACLFDGVSRKRCPAARYGVLGSRGSRRAQRGELEHSLSAGLEGWSVNGPKTSKGRLERARYPIHLNAKPGGHRLSILEPRAAKRW